ncbi:CRISPR-associated helicase/endonuclease Cas3 [soil metagenome]
MKNDHARDAGFQLLATYWGKADPTVGALGRAHHTVLGHSLDVAACAFTLVDSNATLADRLARVTGIAPDAVALTFAAACALHDVGKIDTRFQRKAGAIADVLRPHTAAIPSGKYDHGAEGFRQVEDDETASARIHAHLGPSALPILRAVCGHHGALPARGVPDETRSALPRSVRREDVTARALFETYVIEFFVSRGATLPWPSVADGPLVQRVAGLCAVADWIGSNVDHFPYEPAPQSDMTAYWVRACERAKQACEQAGLLREEPASVAFGVLFPGYSPRDVQVLTEQVNVDEPSLVIVEAEMGKGKTEAALSLASRFLARGVADGITVALPTMATSNAMFTRVEGVVRKLFPSGDVQVALAHSRASRHSGFQVLVQRGLRANDIDAPEASVMCARWLLNKKRVLLAQIGVGTVDQALQAALVVRHQFVRMFGLSRNVVIVDEVHAYDAYMEVLLEHLLGWLGALGVPVILLSATLPSERREALTRAWRGANGALDRDGKTAVADGLEAAKARAYPLVTVATRSATDILAGGSAVEQRTVAIERVVRLESDDDHVNATATRLLTAARAGARVVWIRNTVREAQRAYRAVSAHAGSVEHLLFHARFRGCDRRRIEQLVLDRFGKAAPAGGRVLIATQVVEQSLDLDFDEMHTDLAPVDLLLQRSGRLHRHERARPTGFERPRMGVHVPSEESAAALRFGPSRFVYDAGTLWIADRTLRSRATLALPNDIRALVEESYHPDSRSTLIAEGGPALMAAEAKRAGELEARRTKAKQCCIPPTDADPDGGEALPDDEDAVQAFTRDGMSATLLPFAWDGRGARTLDAAPDSPTWNLDAGRSDAWRLAGDLVDETLSLPARGEVQGRVSLGGRPAWDAWRRLFARFADESGIGTRVVPIPMTPSADGHKGWLRMDGKRRRVLYTRSLGLLMLSEKDEEQAR